MIDTHSINQLVDKLSTVVPDSVKAVKSDLDSNIKAVLESSLRQMNLVSREEFDVQSALLQRSQQKLQQLEQQLDELIRKIDQQ
ncbi:MAG TPA: accessory factor UbiK family protein [Gammaproteobacteria bacterium]